MGYSATLPLGSQVFISGGSLVLQTNPVAASGLYYISASAFLWIDPIDVSGQCYDYIPTRTLISQEGGSSNIYLEQISITDAIQLNAGDYIWLVCFAGNGHGSSYAQNAVLTATLINSGSDTGKKVAHSHALPGNFKRPK